MKSTKLEYIATIIGRKPHFVYKNNQKYFVITTTDNESRGNIFIHPIQEVDDISLQISSSNFPNQFLIDNTFKQIKNIVGGKKLMKKSESYFKSRYRNICYILCALGKLSVHKDGRFIGFKKTSL
jgi:hypothetical protein